LFAAIIRSMRAATWRPSSVRISSGHVRAFGSGGTVFGRLGSDGSTLPNALGGSRSLPFFR